MADFRLCSTCRSRSQAGLCHCAQRAISDRPEPTVARLRYALGGDRPSQTTRHTRSRADPAAVRRPRRQGWYLKGGSARAGARASMPSTYPARAGKEASVKL